MKFSKFLKLNESVELDSSVFQEMELYLISSMGKSIKTMGLNAADIQQVCVDLDIENSDEFLAEFPFPNNKVKEHVSEFFKDYGGSDSDDDLYYGDDEENYWDDYEEEESQVEKEFEVDDDFLNDTATMVYNIIQKAGFENFYVSNSKENISVQFVLNKKEKFSNLIKVAGIIKKVKSDILIQYDAEMDLWETKKYQPLLTYEFYYNPEKKGSVKNDDIELPF